jgi:2-amino-4-hydroxy-6-hydroxymethyldihydropteridine diphosphokinase
MPIAYLGLGSNLGDRAQTLASAIAALRATPGIVVLAESSVRETAPWGPVPQPPYLNAVVSVETELAPPLLLRRLLEIEQALGRDRANEVRFGPRTLDLDILLFGDDVIAEPGLEIPHPRIAERAFVLEPLVELDPGLVIPGEGSAQDLLDRLDSQP